MDELRKRQKIISQLVEARLEQGISQAELARRLGIQRSGINRLESGTQNPTLDMILKIASALGKDVSLELNDKEEPMSNVYSLRIYDTELMRFSMEKQGLSGLVAEILYTNEEQAHLLPLDMERTGEGVIQRRGALWSMMGFIVTRATRRVRPMWARSRTVSIMLRRLWKPCA